MMPQDLHYLAVAIPILLGVTGGGIGLSIANAGSNNAVTRQPICEGPVFQAMMLGMFLIEGSTIIALTVSVLLFLNGSASTWNTAFADLAAGLCVGVASMMVCLASSFTVKAATESIGRQPFFAKKILTLMLVSQSIIEAIVFFAFVVAVIIKTRIVPTMDFAQSMQCLAASLAIILGCIGPAIGQAIFTRSVCTAVGQNRDAYDKIFSFTIFGVAIIEAAMIFCLLLAMVILFAPLPTEYNPLLLIRFAVGATTIGIGSCATAIALGKVLATSCTSLAKEPESYGMLLRTTFITTVLIESVIVYVLIMALLISKM